MRKTISIGAGSLVAAVLTHGFVSSGLDLTGAERLSFFTYRGFFSHGIFGFWRLWTLAHGDASTTMLNGRAHGIDTFGRLFAVAVLLIRPLIGFVLSAFSSHQRISWRWLRPLAIVTVLTFWDVLIPDLAMRKAFLATGLSEPYSESGRAILVTLLLLWSAGVIRFRRSPGPKPIRGIVTA